MSRFPFALAVAVLVTACSHSPGRATSPTTSRPAPSTVSGPQLPPTVLHWLRDYNGRTSLARGSSASWVLTTHGKAATITSGAAPGDLTPVYLFDVRGSFVWHHSCPPGAPPSSCTSRGSHEVFTVDPHRLQVLDYGIQADAPNLAQFGTVGYVDL